MTRHWVIRHPNGTYFCGCGYYGACFGVDLAEAPHFQSKRDAEAMMRVHSFPDGCEVLRKDRALVLEGQRTAAELKKRRPRRVM